MDSDAIACLPDKEGSSIFGKPNPQCNKFSNFCFPRFSIFLSVRPL
jgi:hypothetical protein